MKAMNKKFILIYGFGYSGSGVVLDMMKEYRGVSVNKAFFSIIKNPYGIIDLENSIIDNWDFVKASNAIEDFKWLCKKCAKSSNNYLIPSGLDLENKINKNFIKYVDEYCSKLVKFKYECWNEISDFKTPYIQNITNRILRILQRKTGLRIGPNDQMNFVTVDKDSFYTATQSFINNLFSGYDDDEFIVLDHHPLPIQYADKLNLYFGGNAKMIVVDRDPRGIYYDLVSHNNRLGQELAKNQDWKLYCEWHKQLRRKLPQNENILYLKFEDLVFEYDKHEKIIADFLGLDINDHIGKFKYFDPQISKKNINLWQQSIPGISADLYKNIILELDNFNP